MSAKTTSLPADGTTTFTSPANQLHVGDLPRKVGAWIQSLGGLRIATIGAVLGAFFWSYRPTFQWLIRRWETEPDYSHGYLVAPIAIWFLWMRRDRFPFASVEPAIMGGLAIVAAATAMRWAGTRVYLDSADGWSMMVWIAGVTLLAGGWRVLRWAMPSILFHLSCIQPRGIGTPLLSVGSGEQSRPPRTSLMGTTLICH